MSSSRQQQKLNTESILKKLIVGTDITISTTSDTMTPVKRDGVNVLEIYYRLDSIRINVRLNSEEQDMYDVLLSEGLVFQKDADPYATEGKFAFFVNESDVSAVLRRLLKLENRDNQMDATQGIIARRDELVKWITKEVKPIPVNVSGEQDKVLITFQELLVCGVNILDEGYQIYNASDAWYAESTYIGEQANDSTWSYYLESEDECIAECGRLVKYEAQKGSRQLDKSISYNLQIKKAELEDSDNWKGDPRNRFEIMFRPLIEGSEYYFRHNTTDSSARILELYRNGESKRIMGFSGKQNMTVNVFFNLDFYNFIKESVNLPENKRATKTQPHMNISPAKLWDVICAATGKKEFMTGEE